MTAEFDSVSGSVIILSRNDEISDELLENIFDNNIPKPVEIFPGINSYKWHTVTKYYTADINICRTISPDLVCDPQFIESIQAIICMYDDLPILNELESLQPVLKSCEADVQLFVCKTNESECVETGSEHQHIGQWCIKNQFEFINLLEEEDEFTTVVGYKRVIQALQAHIWPNLDLEEHLSSNFLSNGTSNNSEENKSKVSNEHDDNLNPGKQTATLNLCAIRLGLYFTSLLCVLYLEEELLQRLSLNAAGDESADDLGSFDSLFKNFKEMREIALNLPFEERKVFAEKTVAKFWNTIGGDEDEIALSDEEAS
ncbi:Alpha- and gamma-adaptin-binding protein p34 [Nymphon striatum]|nr:Alpha- and gamma-adaptin-binding protein p34 [Nymphon striatum]